MTQRHNILRTLYRHAPASALPLNRHVLYIKCLNHVSGGTCWGVQWVPKHITRKWKPPGDVRGNMSIFPQCIVLIFWKQTSPKLHNEIHKWIHFKLHFLSPLSPKSSAVGYLLTSRPESAGSCSQLCGKTASTKKLRYQLNSQRNVFLSLPHFPFPPAWWANLRWLRKALADFQSLSQR